MKGIRFAASMLVMLLALGTAIALADEGDSPETDPVLSAAPIANPGPEVVAERTARSETFRLPDGAREARIYASPINYRDDEGDWQPIKEGFEESQGSTLSGEANGFEVSVPVQIDEGPVRLKSEEGWVASQLVGTATDAVKVQGDSASYEGTEGGLSFDLHTLANGLKEEIVLTGPSQPHSFTYELSASNGLTLSLEDDGSIEFQDEEEETIITLPAPVIEDNSSSGPSSDAVAYELEPQGTGEWRLTVKADPEWLASPERAWPVTIDPSMTVPVPMLDCEIGGKKAQKGWGLCGSGGQKSLTLSYKPKLEVSQDEWSRALLRYSLGSVPLDSYIAWASFNARSSEAALNTSGVEIAPTTQSWSQEANWLRYHYDTKNGEKLWASEGGDYGIVLGKVLTSERGTQSGWWNIPISAAKAEEFIPRTIGGKKTEPQPLAFLAKLIDDKSRQCSGSCTQRQLKFESSAAPNPENRPYISVVYYLKAPGESKLLTPAEGTVTARRLALRSALAAGTTGVTYQFREGDNGRFETIPSNLVKDGEGKEVKWPLVVSGKAETPTVYFDAAHATATLRAKGGKLQVRALFDATGSAGYSVPVNATVNRSTGGPKDATAQVGPGTVDLLTGNFTVSRTDVSVPGWGSALEFSRTHSSRNAAAEAEGVLGPGWKPGVAVEAEGGAQWRSVREVVPDTEEQEEGLGPYAILTDLEGYEYAFERDGTNWITPPDATGWVLTKESGVFAFSSPAGNRTTFGKDAGGGEYLPTAITQTGGSANSTQMVYELGSAGKMRLKMIIAPTPAGITCTETNINPGCRVLTFKYVAGTTYGPSVKGDRLSLIGYVGPNGPNTNNDWGVAAYTYNSEGRLTAAWDPRISPNLKETYAYEAGGQLKTITPPGQEPWTMGYGTIDEEEANGRLMNVKRASLVASPTTAQTTIAYGVPVCCGGSAPYGAGSASVGQWVGQWGQKDVPQDATAIFAPDEVPTTSPPSSYARAMVYYLDAEGQTVNVATPSGGGTSAPSITTSETDEFGNVVRELSAQNRLRALAAEKPLVRAEELETKRRFSSDGTQMEEEWGPLHQVRIAESGETKQARLHTVIEYDADWDKVGVKPHLPTKVSTGASIPGKGADADLRVNETEYDWTLRKPIKAVIDSEPGGLKLTTKTAYDKTSGLTIERSLPAEPSGGDAHTTKFIYYTAGTHPLDSACGNKPGYANLPCKKLPAKQPGTAGLPELLVTRYVSYSPWGRPTEVIESPGGKEETTRKAIMTYDAAGRSTASKVVGGGTALPPTATVYSTETGLPVEQKFTCESGCEGFDNQAIVTAYDKLGRPTQYTDADGNTSKTTYDLLERPATIYDGKGTQTFGYDSTSGLLTKLEDSAAGTFTAVYDANGALLERGLPNGLVAKTTYDEVGAPVKLSYVKAGCSEKCTWLEENNERSIYGQILSQTSLGSAQQYSYDKAGRLTLVKDTPTGGECTTRQYLFDADSNRTKMTTRTPGAGGACDTSSEGTSQSYAYDAADRLTGEVSYDSFGRIESLAGKYAGGSALTTTFYSNDMVATQSQGGLTNTYQLDSVGRSRQVVQTGTKTGTEVFHYAMPSDSTAWTERGGTWTRSIGGIGGELAAIRESSGTTTLQLANLHGDIIATASLSVSAKEPLANFEFDEFGNPKKGGAGRYGWLGGKQRRSELPSGVIQMGVRSYVPGMGRFISVDPVLGGSATAYDYASADPVNGLDLDGRKVCKLTAQVGSRRHRVWASWHYGCSWKSWGGPVGIIKRIVKFERHTKGLKDEIISGKFETKKVEEDRDPNGVSKNGRRLEESGSWRCGDLGRTYQIVVELWVVRTMIGFEPELVKLEARGQVTCQR